MVGDSGYSCVSGDECGGVGKGVLVLIPLSS